MGAPPEPSLELKLDAPPVPKLPKFKVPLVELPITNSFNIWLIITEVNPHLEKFKLSVAVKDTKDDVKFVPKLFLDKFIVFKVFGNVKPQFVNQQFSAIKELRDDAEFKLDIVVKFVLKERFKDVSDIYLEMSIDENVFALTAPAAELSKFKVVKVVELPEPNLELKKVSPQFCAVIVTIAFILP